MKKIGLIGLGLIGKERVRAVNILQQRRLPIEIKAVLDPGQKDIQAIAQQAGANICANLDEMMNIDTDLIIVCVPHDAAVDITKTLLDNNKSVLLEKPMGRNLTEAKKIAAACKTPSQLKIAYNYRFFPGVCALISDINAGRFGQPIGFSLVLGHGGSPDDGSTWKLNKTMAGGGALIDPGIHLIDLCNLVGGQVDLVAGRTWDGFWKTGIEEECRLVLRSQNIPIIDLTVSVVRWRSTFRLEFFGEDGYGIVEGRGRSYGPQKYIRGSRWGWRTGKTQVESEETVVVSSCDEVFADEIQAMLFGMNSDQSKHVASAEESLKNMETLDKLRMGLKLID